MDVLTIEEWKDICCVIVLKSGYGGPGKGKKCFRPREDKKEEYLERDRWNWGLRRRNFV